MKRVDARRRFLSLLASLPTALLPLRAARAQADPFAPLLRELTGGAPVTRGRVTIDTPMLADNGLSVPLNLSIESAMTAADHVRSIALFSEKNPRPLIAKFQLGAAAAAAKVVTVSATVNGKMLVYVVGAPTFVNADFNAAFPSGLNGTLVIVKT